MARDIEAGGVSRTTSKPALMDDIPEWAKPQRAYVFEWADRTLAGEGQLKNQPEVLYVASAIKSGKADVLVFDNPLYDEVVSAELEGWAEYDAASWPYPVSVVRLVGLPGIYGVAVCRASDVNAYAKRQGLPQMSEAGSLHTFFIGDGLGAVDASLKARREADRLITYLDCDNANINTIYIDGGPRTDRRSESVEKPQDDAEYRVGADYVTGTKVVVERDQQRDAPRQTRRAHFRRGFYKRFRIGPREDWHYEIRWVKPTFVHGSSQAVTQHKVTRIVLG